MTKSGARNLWHARIKPCARAYRIRISGARVFFISSSGVRVRLSHGAFAVSMRRFPDHRSMDGCELQLFSFPERDVVVPTLRDARQRTSEPSLSHCGPGVNFRPTEPLGSSLPHWATVKGVPNYRNAAVRGFILSVAFSTHAYPNVLCSSGLVHPAQEPASLPRLFALRLGPLDH